jgi:hypothetical protein
VKRLSGQLATFTFHTNARAVDEMDVPGLRRRIARYDPAAPSVSPATAATSAKDLPIRR